MPLPQSFSCKSGGTARQAEHPNLKEFGLDELSNQLWRKRGSAGSTKQTKSGGTNGVALRQAFRERRSRAKQDSCEKSLSTVLLGRSALGREHVLETYFSPWDSLANTAFLSHTSSKDLQLWLGLLF